MHFNIEQRNGLWVAVFTNGHVTEGRKNANQAIADGNAYNQLLLIQGGK